MYRSHAGEPGAHHSSDSPDASDSQDGAMDEDDLFAGSMEIDDPAASPASRAAAHVGAPRPGVDEDMSEVAQIMLNLRVSALSSKNAAVWLSAAEWCQ